jgi:hypothetical protein
LDTFQGGTLLGWGGGASPTNIATGGPAGAGDRYLQVTGSGAGGAGGVPATSNGVQWSGNYSAAGVTAILKTWFEAYKGPGEIQVTGFEDVAAALQTLAEAEANFAALP